MSLTQKRVNQIIKEELNRALAQRGLYEMDDMPMEDEMDVDTGIDVVPDDDMGGEDIDMGGMEMEPVAAEIDWSQFEDDDADEVGAAFLNAVKQLKEENPDESPTAEQVVALMQELMAAAESERAESDEPGTEEMEDVSAMGDEEEEEEADQLDEGVNWLRRANLLAGTGKRR